MDLLEKPKTVAVGLAMLATIVWALTHKEEFEKRAKEQGQVYTNAINTLLEKPE